MRAGRSVLEITTGGVRVSAGGSGRRPQRSLVDAALDWIDDPVGLFGDRPVAVADMWRSVMVTLLGPRCEAVLIVHPEEWPRARIDRVLAAANTVSDHVEAVGRQHWPGATADRAGTRDACAPEPARRKPRPFGGRRSVRRLGVVAAVVLAAAIGWLAVGHASRGNSGAPVLDGRMAVQIPPGWIVQRVGAGPGSRRIQASAPDDPAIVLHLTWSYAPETTLADAAETFAAAITHEPPGVFVDLRKSAVVAGRSAVTYRETRPGRVVDWVIVLSGSTRIGIGCQSPPGREADIRGACEDAVQSAHQR